MTQMNNIITDDMDVVYYVVKVNGNIVSPRYSEMLPAQMAIQQLSEAHQSIAEVVPVTVDGKQVLLG